MLFLLDARDPAAPFPDVGLAERDPDGLLAVGGDLSLTRLINAYRQGIFPWYGEGDPILWWSPDPRTVLFPERLRVNRSLRKTLRRRAYATSMDRDFQGVIAACAAPRRGASGTWLVPEMIAAYRRLHARGLAHSVEVWQDGALMGGLYGVALGRAFFGESMFSRAADASKVALVHLCNTLSAWGFGLVDCQMVSDHLLRMGALEVRRVDFIRLLRDLSAAPGREGSWDQGLVYPEPPSASQEADG